MLMPRLLMLLTLCAVAGGCRSVASSRIYSPDSLSGAPPKAPDDPTEDLGENGAAAPGDAMIIGPLANAGPDQAVIRGSLALSPPARLRFSRRFQWTTSFEGQTWTASPPRLATLCRVVSPRSRPEQ